MKKPLFLALIICFPFFTWGQSLVIFDSLGNNVNGQTLIYVGSLNDSLIKLHFGVKNNSANSMDVKMKRTEIGKLNGTQNYFCWSICYNPVNSGSKPTWTDIGSVVMEPDTLYENFSAYLLPNGLSGVLGFHFLLFDVNNPSDTASVDIIFDISMGAGENFIVQGDLSLSPVPATNKLFVRSNREFSESNTLEIYDLIGKKVEAIELIQNQKSVSLNTYSYFPGIYFCVFKENGLTVSTKKFVVSN